MWQVGTLCNAGMTTARLAEAEHGRSNRWVEATVVTVSLAS